MSCRTRPAAARRPTAGGPGARHADAEGARAAGPPVRTLDSQALLQGQPVVQIEHRGEIYRLQATRLGKLILTK